MTTRLVDTVESFNAAFSRQNMNDVMTFFADDAEFVDLDGKLHKGTKAVRKAFYQAFDGAFGKMVFHEKQLLVDEVKREVSMMWYCQHSHDNTMQSNLLSKVSHFFFHKIFGKQCYWHGIDYLTFNEKGLIVKKETFAKTRLPLFNHGINTR